MRNVKTETLSGYSKPCDTCMRRAVIDENGVEHETNCMCGKYKSWFGYEWKAIREMFGYKTSLSIMRKTS